MKKHYELPISRSRVSAAIAVALALAGVVPNALAGASSDDDWKVNVTYENDTRVRGRDDTGDFVGLSKFRNTLQMDAQKKFENGWSFRAILRGTFDGVYLLNDTEFGDKAGSRSAADVRLGNSAGPAAAAVGFPLPGLNLGSTVPFGGGLGYTVIDAIEAGAGLPNLGGPGGGPGINLFVDPNYANPNSPPSQYGSGAGLIVIGQGWHGQGAGVSFAVPVRPCDVDHRGCTDFGGYGDLTRNQLMFPEFNSRLDFLREIYTANTIDLSGGKELYLKIGRQQVVWGRTDLFRVLDVINPVDFSRNNIYDELQDIRIPMWIATAEWRLGASSFMQDQNVQVVWNFDKFRPDNLGQCGTANVALDAGCFFRGMKMLWDTGGTVGNFAAFAPPGTPGAGTGPWFAVNFGPHQIGIRNVDLPDWSLKNTQLGVKYEGVTQNELSFSLNALTYRSQLPSLHAINGEVVNAFTGGLGNTSPFSGPAQGVPVSRLIAFDMLFPRVNLIGGSMDFQWTAAKAAVRIEGAYTSGEEFVNTSKPELFSRNHVFRSVIGIDRPTFIDWINPLRTTLISAQLFYQHIFDHDLTQGQFGPVGMPDWKDDVTATLLIKSFFHGDRISPQVIFAYDVRAHAAVMQPSLEWIFTDKLKVSFGANVKGAWDRSSWNFDDCRSCNPWAPFTTYEGQGLEAMSAGLASMEPLGRFRAGPIGAAWKENEAFVTVKYTF